jgi:hypothetical protein
MRVPRKSQAPLTLLGSCSTTEQEDQSIMPKMVHRDVLLTINVGDKQPPRKRHCAGWYRAAHHQDKPSQPAPGLIRGRPCLMARLKKNRRWIAEQARNDDPTLNINRRSRPSLLTQLKLLNLPSRGFRQLAKHHSARHLETGQVFFAMCHDVFGRGLRASL